MILLHISSFLVSLMTYYNSNLTRFIKGDDFSQPFEEKTTLLNWLHSASIKGMTPSYFSRYFQFKRHNIHDYDIRNKNKLVINRVKLKSTKRAFLLCHEN